MAIIGGPETPGHRREFAKVSRMKEFLESPKESTYCFVIWIDSTDFLWREPHSKWEDLQIMALMGLSKNLYMLLEPSKA